MNPEGTAVAYESEASDLDALTDGNGMNDVFYNLLDSMGATTNVRASVAMLGLRHCERNGHHYNYGLSMLSAKDKAQAVRHHPDLYTQRGDEWFLNIRDGAVNCASLQVPGFGIHDEPDWDSMTELGQWIASRYPA